MKYKKLIITTLKNITGYEILFHITIPILKNVYPFFVKYYTSIKG